jgi:excisionase family DNA binding protein
MKRSIEELKKMQIIYLTVEEFMDLQDRIGKETNLSLFLPNIMSIDDAAVFTGYKKSTLYRKTCMNDIPHYKCGNKIFFKKEELERWILNNRVESTDEYCENLDMALQAKAKKIV